MHPQRPNPACTVGRGIQAALLPIYAHAERAMEADLDQTTVGSLLATVSARK
jgi:hypothetical protein